VTDISDISPELAWSTVEHYLGERQSASYRLSPPEAGRKVTYEIDDDGRGISLYVELDRTQRPPRSDLPAVRIDLVAHHGLRMARIHTTEVLLMRDFHEFLMAVAGRILGGGKPLEHAFQQTVRAWSALLDRPRALDLQKRLGLLGELAVLGHLAERRGWLAALDAWVGPQGEEHDFALLEGDIEVKTTASEERRHTIHGLGQLDASPGRPLWFVSLRLTRGGQAGRTLRETVYALRDAAAAEHITYADRIDKALAATGWSADLPDDERWTPRDDPLVLRAETLPRLHSGLLPATTLERVSSIRYDIDVTGLTADAAAPLDLTGLRLP
jgi:hypothetical protein